MILEKLSRGLCVAALTLLAAGPVSAQQKEPTPAAVELARDIIEVKGGLNMFDPVISGVIEYHKNLLVAGNPTASNDLEAVAAKLRTEYSASRVKDIQTEIARGFASQLSEQELREVLAFYRTPLGKKLIEAEPKGLDEAAKRVETWAEKFAGEVTTRMRAEMKVKGHNLL